MTIKLNKISIKTIYMISKFLSSVLAGFLLSTSLLSQSLNWGEEQEKKASETVSRTIGMIGEGPLIELYEQAGNLYGVKVSQKKHFLMVFDSENNLVQKEALAFEVNGKKLDYLETFFLNDKLYSLCSLINKKLKKKFLYAYQLDTKTLKPIGEAKKIAETNFTKSKQSFNFQFMAQEGSIYYSISPNHSYLSLLTIARSSKNDPMDYQITVLDEQLELVWEKNIDKSKVSRWLLMNMKINDLGNVYFIGLRLSTQEKNSKPLRGYDLMAYRNEGSAFEAYPLDVDDLVFMNFNLTFGTNQDVVLTGINVNEKNLRKVEGLYYMIIDGTSLAIKAEEQVQFNQQTKEEINNFEDTNGDSYPSRLVYNDILIGKDGDIFLLWEKSIKYTYHREGGSFSETFGLGDIIVSKISVEKGIEWSSSIKKHQSLGAAHRDQGVPGSYLWHLSETGLHLLFSENVKQYGIAIGSGRDHVWTYANIGLDGEIKRKKVTHDADTQSKFIPGSSSVTDSGKIILINSQYNKFQVGTLIFK